MKTRRIVITGGPGTGKTSLIEYLEEQGHTCLHEISRAVILKAKEEGIDQLFLADPILFSRLLLDGRLAQFEEAQKYEGIQLFYDRGMPDVTAYMDYLGTSYGEEFSKPCQTHKYDIVFLLPPWREIYKQDNERYESFDQAQLIFKHLKEGYQSYGYKVVEVPIGSVDKRVQFILDHLKNLS